MDKTPLHKKQKQAKSMLKPSLRKKQGTRSMQVRKGDKVQVMRGKYRGRTGEVQKVYLKKPAVEVEDIEVEKTSGEKANVKIHPSNLKITKLNKEDPKRTKTNEKESE